MNGKISTSILIDELHRLHKALCAVVTPLNNLQYRCQFVSDLSPLGWHLGHTTFIEAFWLHQVVPKDVSYVNEQSSLYIPENSVKSERGGALPPKRKLLHDTKEQQQNTRRLLAKPPAKAIAHRLFRDNYLLCFLLQHHAMHLETMYAILTAKNKQEHSTPSIPIKNPETKLVNPKLTSFPSGQYDVGSEQAACFDNEKPKHRRHLHGFALSRNAASNNEYLSFINADGYQNKKYWSQQGWEWCQRHRIFAPNGWQQYDNNWYIVSETGVQNLIGDEAVYGISRYEAAAFACWAGARLPHEHELEIAQQTDNKINLSDTWEWCDNVFYPYDGYQPFPYKEYSQPWFDNGHYTLRGSSYHMPAIMRRASLRNFYTADKRHVRTGVRLAFDA